MRFDEAYYNGAIDRLGVAALNARRARSTTALRANPMSRGTMLTELLARDLDHGVVDSDHLIEQFLLGVASSVPYTVEAGLIPGSAYVKR